MQGSVVNSNGRLVALEIASMLHDWWSKHPDGLTLKLLMRYTGLSYHMVHAASVELMRMGKAKWISRPDRSPTYLVPLDWEYPAAFDLTAKQRGVLDWMAERVDADGRLTASMRQICDECMRSKGGIVALMDALCRKGYVQRLVRGQGTTPSQWRVYPNGDGPRRYL